MGFVMKDKRLSVSVDDLIVEYMILKVQLGYKSSYTIDEFKLFIDYFSQFVDVYDVISDFDKLFDRFFERKKNDWMIIRNIPQQYESNIYATYRKTSRYISSYE